LVDTASATLLPDRDVATALADTRAKAAALRAQQLDRPDCDQ
jgi:hypothetical protein